MSRPAVRSRQLLVAASLSALWVASPTRLAAQSDLETADWPAWIAGTALFASLLLADQPARTATLDWRDAGSERVARLGRWYGDWKSSVPYLLGATFVVGAATEGTTGLAKGVAVVAGTLAGSLTSEALNQAIGRGRPLEEQGSLTFTPFSGHASFPSGHTAFAYSFAGSIDAVTDGWVPAAAAYGAAAITGLSRVHDDKHWLSDVVAGAVIGVVVARTVASRVRTALAPGSAASRGRELDGAAQPARAAGPRVRLVAGSSFLGFEVRY